MVDYARRARLRREMKEDLLKLTLEYIRFLTTRGDYHAIDVPEKAVRMASLTVGYIDERVLGIDDDVFRGVKDDQRSPDAE